MAYNESKGNRTLLVTKRSRHLCEFVVHIVIHPNIKHNLCFYRPMEPNKESTNKDVVPISDVNT